MEGFVAMKISNDDFLKGLMAGKKNQLVRTRVEREISSAIYETKITILEKDIWDIEYQLEEDE